eukprot:TRINITY_DN3537_c0_g2_i1.p1 TRINITY_DN3537_c0_g2~~TRINITY_DN3537_c0_g2_i1.p1  ORF type:complete len:276 (-),score=53.06 TRINITY_DN3537_c0_g2_i1:31-858(-)
MNNWRSSTGEDPFAAPPFPNRFSDLLVEDRPGRRENDPADLPSRLDEIEEELRRCKTQASPSGLRRPSSAGKLAPLGRSPSHSGQMVHMSAPFCMSPSHSTQMLHVPVGHNAAPAGGAFSGVNIEHEELMMAHKELLKVTRAQQESHAELMKAHKELMTAHLQLMSRGSTASAVGSGGGERDIKQESVETRGASPHEAASSNGEVPRQRPQSPQAPSSNGEDSRQSPQSPEAAASNGEDPGQGPQSPQAETKEVGKSKEPSSSATPASRSASRET